MDWKLHEIFLAREGDAQMRLVGGVPFKTEEQAALYAEKIVKTYPRSGFDKKRRHWWCEDLLGTKVFFAISHGPNKEFA